MWPFNRSYWDRYNTELLRLIKRGVIDIMATQAETAQELRDLKVQNDRDRQEVLDKLAELEAAIGQQADTSQEVTDALNDLKASVQARDSDVQPG